MFIISFIFFVGFIQHDDELKKIIPPCPDSPNCVNSVYANDEKHFMKPIRSDENVEKEWEKLVKILNEDKNVTVNKHEEGLIKSEFKIPVFGFVDDVIFYLDRENEIIHFRSASRVGYYDFGVNRNRIRKIRRKLNKE
ncbi:MAG: DUF1499 domain-containing protein [Candidatus Cyclobacteriaceae bacterium M2_1C_046]